jgi:hypothetical protein
MTCEQRCNIAWRVIPKYGADLNCCTCGMDFTRVPLPEMRDTPTPTPPTGANVALGLL